MALADFADMRVALSIMQSGVSAIAKLGTLGNEGKQTGSGMKIGTLLGNTVSLTGD